MSNKRAYVICSHPSQEFSAGGVVRDDLPGAGAAAVHRVHRVPGGKPTLAGFSGRRTACYMVLNVCLLVSLAEVEDQDAAQRSVDIASVPRRLQEGGAAPVRGRPVYSHHLAHGHPQLCELLSLITLLVYSSLWWL